MLHDRSSGVNSCRAEDNIQNPVRLVVFERIFRGEDRYKAHTTFVRRPRFDSQQKVLLKLQVQPPNSSRLPPGFGPTWSWLRAEHSFAHSLHHLKSAKLFHFNRLRDSIHLFGLMRGTNDAIACLELFSSRQSCLPTIELDGDKSRNDARTDKAGSPVGSSSGLNYCAAQIADGHWRRSDAVIVTVFPDRIELFA